MNLRLARLDITLLPERAAWLPAWRAVVVGDLHLGKSATFRARGIPVPEGETSEDLARLGALIRRTGAERLLVVGDLVHSADGLAPGVISALRDFLRDSPVSTTLIEGNHDRAAGLRDLDLAFEIRRDLEIDGLTLVHDPADLPAAVPAICGHLHPSILLPESPRRRVRVPCFHLWKARLALPGFGSFTGTHPVHPEPGDRVFVPLRDEVREVPLTH